MKNKIFWLDTETSGLDAVRNDILQIAYIIEIDKEVKEKGQFYCQPFSFDNLEQSALDINCLEIAQIKTFPSPQEIHKKIKAVLEKYVDKYDKNDKFSMTGYNVQFDFKFLQEFFKKSGDFYFGSLLDYHTMDILSLVYIMQFKGKINLPNYKLVTVCEALGIELQAHNAMSDIEATRKVFYELLKYVK